MSDPTKCGTFPAVQPELQLLEVYKAASKAKRMGDQFMAYEILKAAGSKIRPTWL